MNESMTSNTKLEFEVTHTDGRQICWQLTLGEFYEYRGTETEVRVVRVVSEHV